MSIYLITKGEYSDYHVEGYCTTQEAAERVVAVRNTGVEDGWELSQIEECECLDDTVPDTVKPVWVYTYQISYDQKSWHYIHVYTKPIISDKRGIEIARESTGPHGVRNRMILIYLTERDDDRSWKIFLDTLAQINAEELGL